MIPDQPLTNPRGDPLPFLSWVPKAAIPPVTHEPFRDTVTQLLATFHDVVGIYRLVLPPELTAWQTFQKAADQPGVAVVRPPSQFLPAETGAHFLRFDWRIWLEHAGYLLGETHGIT